MFSGPVAHSKAKMWSDYLHSLDGGALKQSEARKMALQILKTEHPSLEELKMWSDHLYSFSA